MGSGWTAAVGDETDVQSFTHIKHMATRTYSFACELCDIVDSLTGDDLEGVTLNLQTDFGACL